MIVDVLALALHVDRSCPCRVSNELSQAAWSGVQAAVKGGDALPCAPCESGGFAPGKNNENTAMIMVSLVLAGSSLVDLVHFHQACTKIASSLRCRLARSAKC